MHSSYYPVTANALKDTLYLETEVMVAHACNYSTEENSDRRITNIGYTVRPYSQTEQTNFQKASRQANNSEEHNCWADLIAKTFSE